MTRTERQVEIHLCVLRRTGHAAEPGARVLDFGCGAGAMVESLNGRGFDAWGCDIVMNEPTDRLRLISADPYRVPFDDESFDVVLSDQVFEHVQDPDVAWAELRRVLRPGGVGLHVFPPRWRLREAHTYVPFGGAIESPRWFAAWARAGVRNEFQGDMAPAEVARANVEFTRAMTNYPTKSALRDHALAHFEEARFVEDALIACAPGRAARMAPLARLLGPAYSGLRSRAMLVRGPRAA